MATEHTSEWMSKLIERGEDVGQCIAFLKEIAEMEERKAERNNRRIERELDSREKDKELELKKIQLREKELALKEVE